MMAINTRAYKNDISNTTIRATRERTGGPRGDQSGTPSELLEYFTTSKPFGSHMPLDTVLHWDWRNPLNIIPGFILLLFVLTVIGLIIA
jgi:hypothetical protein